VNNVTTRALTVLLFASAVALAVLLFYAGAAWRARVTTGAWAPRINMNAQADLEVGLYSRSINDQLRLLNADN
jgi:hypothetical protein